MAINKELLGPQKGEEEDFAIEDLVFSTQLALQTAMRRKGMSKKDLAAKLNMTPARVSQIFASKGSNLTLKTIGRIAHALGEEFTFVRQQEVRSALPEKRAKEFKYILLSHTRRVPSEWQERAANSVAHRQAAAA